MSSVQIEYPKLRLATQLKEAGGMTVADAVEEAQSGLEELRPECKTELQRSVRAAEDLLAKFPPAFAPEPLQELYVVASRAVGLGAICQSPASDAALVSLCDLLDRLATSRRWDPPAITVHVQTLQLLAFNIGGVNDPKMTSKVLAGLKKVSDRYAGITAPEPPRLAAAG
jgi:hypothetical protein